MNVSEQKRPQNAKTADGLKADEELLMPRLLMPKVAKADDALKADGELLMPTRA